MKFLDDFSQEVWRSTYKQFNDNNINDTLKRVANSIASAEKTKELKVIWENNFNELLEDLKFCPGGRILSNAGNYWNGTTLLNCYVGPKPKHDQDSLEGILEVLKSQCKTLKSEGGWGMNFSFIRPRGSFIHGIGVESPGSVKYMEIFDKTSDVITSGSGIKSKNEKSKGKIRKGAMMGILDCVSGETEIWTLNGKIKIKDLVGKNPLVYCTDSKGNIYIRKANKVWSKGIKKTVKIKFDDDTYLICTPEHEIMLKDGSYTAAKNLSFGNSVAVLHKRLYDNYYQLGVTGYRKVIAEHIAVAEYKYNRYPNRIINENKSFSIDNEEVHHIDFNSLNNNPENLEILKRKDHVLKHKDRTIRLLNIEREKINVIRKNKTWEEFYGIEKAKEIKEKYLNSRLKNKRNAWNKGLKEKEYKQHYKDGFKNQFSNHKVVSVETHEELEVFDISVPDFHNFVANGVFVHNCWHPDIEEFITAKLQENRLSKFNISVNCSNEFMEKIIKVNQLIKDSINPKTSLQNFDSLIREESKWDLMFPDTTYEKYKSEWDGNINLWKSKGYPIKVYKTVNILDLWEKIMVSTYQRNDPGVLFLDRANETHCWNYGGIDANISASNPCAEQTLPFGGVCNLGSLNLTQFVKENSYDFDKIKKYTSFAVRFLDNVNDVTNAPLNEYKDFVAKRRRIGLGIMGWASSLYMMKIKFASEEAEKIKFNLMKCITDAAIKTSISLAKEKGMFDGCIPEKHANAKFFNQIKLDNNIIDDIKKYGIRNSSLFSIQPTGNTSILANIVSGGIEPIFMPEYIRTVIVNNCPDSIKDLCPKYWEGEFRETELFKFHKEGNDIILKGIYDDITYKIDKNRGLTKEVICMDYGVRFLKEKGDWDINENWAVSTNKLSPEEHIKDMNGFAIWMDSSISKTINLPNNYDYDNFKNIYLDAYKTGYLKGITTYRDGTMTTVLSSINKNDENIKSKIPKTSSLKRPKELNAELHHFNYSGKRYYVAVGLLDNEPFEVFTGYNEYRKDIYIPKDVHSGIIRKLSKGKYVFITKDNDEYHLTNGHNSDTADSMTRLISLNLRHGCSISFIIEQLQKTCGDMMTFSKLLARTLKRYIKDGVKSTENCPECGTKLIFSEGCQKCICGFSKCG